jgi:predicted nucleic acid-binding protein
MPEIVIPDASCLILMHKIGKVDILCDLYEQVTITHEISKEYRMPLPQWMRIDSVDHLAHLKLIQSTHKSDRLGSGEKSAMMLALSYTSHLLVIDDLVAREVARSLGLRITGTLGLFLKAKQCGIISSIADQLEAIKKTNFYISSAVEKEILRLANEF